VVSEVLERGCTAVIRPKAYQECLNSHACRGELFVRQ